MARRALAGSSPTGGSDRQTAAGQCPGSATSGDERALRRSLGPAAWAVLADLSMDAEPDGAGGFVVATSARLVAAHLGIAKDTAARALRRLSEEGILCRRPQGTSPAGRFAAGTYELHLPLHRTLVPCAAGEDTVSRTRPGRADAASTATPVSLPTATASAPPRRRTRAIGGGAAQLSLLDPVPEDIGTGDSEPVR